MRSLELAVVLLVAMVGIAGCGGDSTSESGGGPGTGNDDTSSGEHDSSSFTVCLNGSYFVCPDEDAEVKCGGSPSDCSSCDEDSSKEPCH